MTASFWYGLAHVLSRSLNDLPIAKWWERKMTVSTHGAVGISIHMSKLVRTFQKCTVIIFIHLSTRVLLSSGELIWWNKAEMRQLIVINMSGSRLDLDDYFQTATSGLKISVDSRNYVLFCIRKLTNWVKLVPGVRPTDAVAYGGCIRFEFFLRFR